VLKDMSMMNFSRKSDQFFQRYAPNCGKMPYFANFEESFKKFLDPDLQADDF